MASIHKTTSPYVNTDIKDFYLDIWDEIIIEPSIEDTIMTVGPKYHKRPDLLSYDLYGTPRLYWVFIVRNMNLMKDPIEDFVSGLEIYVPSKERIEEYI